MRIALSILVIVLSLQLSAQSKDEKEIRSILATQTAAWNRGDIDQFMNGYWEKWCYLWLDQHIEQL